MPVPPRRTSASPLSPYQSVRLPARTRKSYVRIPGVDGVAAVALQIAPRRCIATYRFPKWSVALEGFVPVTRSRSVTFEPARTAPNGLRYAVLKLSWKSLRPAASAGPAASRALTRATSTSPPLDPMRGHYKRPGRARSSGVFEAGHVRVAEAREHRVPSGDVVAHLRQVDVQPLALRDLAVAPDETLFLDDPDVILIGGIDRARERRHHRLAHSVDREA